MGDIRFQCPSCQRALLITAEAAGVGVRCPDCGAVVDVPVPAAGEQASANAEFEYDAFISYRHVEPDRSAAKWLHGELERYRTPPKLVKQFGVAPKLTRVFRDEEELQASASLTDAIKAALQKSRYLIVVCSPSAADSDWVNKEVEFFRGLGRHDRILALLTEGEPAHAFPPALREIRQHRVDSRGREFDYIEQVEPLAPDIRLRDDESERDLKYYAKLRILSTLLGCKYDDLRRRDEQRARNELAKRLVRTLIAASVVGAIITALWLQTLASRERERRALAELAKAAPSFFAEARLRLDEGDFTNALEKISYAVTLRPNDADYRLLRAHVLQSMERFRDARADYARVLKLRGDDALAKTNVKLSEHLHSLAQGGNVLSADALLEWRAALVQQGRSMEAMHLAKRLRTLDDRLFAAWQAQLDRAGIRAQLKRTPEGQPRLALTNIMTGDLSAFAGIPLVRLDIFGGTVSNLSALTGMPLRYVSFRHVPVSDLTPLRMAPLNGVDFVDIPLRDLTPIRGKNIQFGYIRRVSVVDFTPLQGSSLQNLDVGETRVSDLTFLRQSKAQHLTFTATRVADLTPLASLKLLSLHAAQTRVTNIEPLAGMPLRELSLSQTKVTNLSPLAGTPIETLEIAGVPAEHFGPLQGLPLRKLNVSGTRFSDLGMIRKSTLDYLDAHDSAVTDLTPLRGTKIRALYLSGCQADIDLTPLVDCTNLHTLTVPVGARCEPLRKHGSIRRLGFFADNAGDTGSVERFWAEYDRARAAK